jgi:hypothetical protein
MKGKKPKIDIPNAIIIAISAALLIYVLIVLGKSPMGFVFPSAAAGEATITWEAPVRNCDGTSLTNLKQYELIYGQVKQVLPLTPRSKVVTGLTPGTWWFSLAAVNTNDVRSEFVTSSKTITPAQFVTKSTTVYTFVRAEGNVLVLPTAHTVPLGTQCDAAQSVNGKYVLPRSAVSWSGSARLAAALGDCG